MTSEFVVDVFKNGGLLSKRFENYNERQSQIDLAVKIYNSYDSATNLLAEAPTGIGKSLAGLVPAILFAINNKHKTLISTSTKALQMQYYNKDLPFLYELFDKKFSYAMLKGRSNYLCPKRLFEYYENNASMLDMNQFPHITTQWYKLKNLYDSDVNFSGDFEDVGSINFELQSEICSDSDDCDGKDCNYSCPYRRAVRRASDVDIILVNTSLFCIDLIARNKGFGGILPSYHSVIIDEAHELENILSNHIGSQMSQAEFVRAIKFSFKYINSLKKTFNKNDDNKIENVNLLDSEMQTISKTIKKNISSFFDNFVDVSDVDDSNETLKDSTMILSKDDYDSLVAISCRKTLKAINKYCDVLGRVGMFNTSDKLENMLQKVVKKFDTIKEKIEQFMAFGKHGSLEFVYWLSYTAKRHNPIIEWCPIDISGYLKNWLFKRLPLNEWIATKERLSFGENEYSYLLPLKNVVLMSATLTTNKDFNFIKERLGVCDNSEIILPHAFDYAHNVLLYIPKGLVEPNISANSKVFTLQLANNIVEVANITNGKMLCLFTSYNEMKKVYDIVYPDLSQKFTIFNQTQYSKTELINNFKNDINSVLFATSSFWTGVDFQGETLSALVIDRIPFPVPSDPIISARIDKIKANGGDWFNSYYIPMASMELCQGFGRLIRTNTDAGIIMINDVRLITKSYGYKLLGSFPDTLKTRKIQKVEVFYDIVKKRRSIRNARREEDQ